MSNIAFEAQGIAMRPHKPGKVSKTLKALRLEQKEQINSRTGIAFRMKNRREELGLKATALVQAVGITYTRYTNYENGLREPSALTLIPIAEALYCDPAYLAGYTDEVNPVKASPESEKPLIDGCVQFTAEYLEQQQLSAEHLLEFEIQDDIMEPALNRGDIVIVDKQSTKLESRQPFLIELFGRRSVRWLTPRFDPEGGAIISTDKLARRGDEIRINAEELKTYSIIGKVIGLYKTTL